jgi:hypothetical protein
MHLHLQFTTVASLLNQGIIRIRAGYRIRGLFCFFLDKQKEKKEQHELKRENYLRILCINRRRGFQPPTGFPLTPVRILSIISYFRPDCINYD